MATLTEEEHIRLAVLTDRLERLTTDVKDLNAVVYKLTSLTQSLDEGAEASRKTAEALALALKDAKDTAEGTARAKAQEKANEVQLKDQQWTPYNRLFVSLGGIAALAGTYAYLNPRP